MTKLSVFIDKAYAQNGIGIYVWGGNGELLTGIDKTWIERHESSAANAKRAIAMYEKRKNIPGARACDCSGLVVYSLIACGAKQKGFDKTAEGFRSGMCTEIKKADLKNGDLCFKMSGGKANHVGIYYNGLVIEAKGRDYGVVANTLGTFGWSKFGRLNIDWEKEEKGFVLTRNLKKGCKGEDVKWVQQRLMVLGFALPKYGADGSYGSETISAVKAFQKKNGLKSDGIVGKNTIVKLGGSFK